MERLLIKRPFHKTLRKSGVISRLVSVTLLLSSQTVAAIEPTDTLHHRVAEVTVSGKQTAPGGPRITKGGEVRINASDLLTGMRVLGQSDVINSLLTLPGFSTSSDYASGVSINGDNYSQVVYTINGAPIFYPYHFGGVFSTFNTSHITSLNVSPGIRAIGDLDRIGSEIAVECTPETPSQLKCVLDVGIISSGATISVPIKEKTTVTASARTSYLNAIYGDLLTTHDNATRYSFTDGNFTLAHRFSDADKVDVNFLGNTDHLIYDDGNYATRFILDWHNIVASARWHHTSERVNSTLTGGFSTLGNSLDLTMPQFGVLMPASITQGILREHLIILNDRLTIGADGRLTRMKPQYAIATGSLISSGTPAPPRVLHSVDGRVYGQWSQKIGEKWRLMGGLRVSLYHISDATYANADPQITAVWENRAHNVSLQLSSSTQYLHQIGLSEIGLSSNYWIPSDKDILPQKAYGAMLHYGSLWLDGQLAFSADVHYKRVLHDPQFMSDILGILDRHFSYLDHIESTDGFNAGGSVMLRLTLGRMAISGSYNLAFARRRYASSPDRYLPSNDESLHNIKAQAAFRFNSHWSANAQFTYSTGRPYTPIKKIYMFGGNVISEYGEHNSSRLPAYHRLDLSGNYEFGMKIGNKPLRGIVTLSVLNAYAHNNVELQYFKFNKEENNFYLKQSKSLVRLLPSLSFTLIL